MYKHKHTKVIKMFPQPQTGVQSFTFGTNNTTQSKSPQPNPFAFNATPNIFSNTNNSFTSSGQQTLQAQPTPNAFTSSGQQQQTLQAQPTPNAFTSSPFGQQNSQPITTQNTSNPITTSFGQPISQSLTTTQNIQTPHQNELLYVLVETQNIQRDILKELQHMNKNVNQQNSMIGLNKCHMGITCDICKKANIIGNRWKCLFCKDYDICDECDKNGQNDYHEKAHQHTFIRIKDTESFNIKITQGTFLNVNSNN